MTWLVGYVLACISHKPRRHKDSTASKANGVFQFLTTGYGEVRKRAALERHRFIMLNLLGGCRDGVPRRFMTLIEQISRGGAEIAEPVFSCDLRASS